MVWVINQNGCVKETKPWKMEELNEESLSLFCQSCLKEICSGLLDILKLTGGKRCEYIDEVICVMMGVKGKVRNEVTQSKMPCSKVLCRH